MRSSSRSTARERAAQKAHARTLADIESRETGVQQLYERLTRKEHELEDLSVKLNQREAQIAEKEAQVEREREAMAKAKERHEKEATRLKKIALAGGLEPNFARRCARGQLRR